MFGLSSLNVRSQPPVDALLGLDRSENHVDPYRRATQVVVSYRSRQGASDCRGARSDGRLGHPLGPDRCLWIGKVHGIPIHLQRDVENGWRPVVMETPGERHAILLVVHPLLAARVANTLNGAAVQLSLESSWVDHRAAVGDAQI